VSKEAGASYFWMGDKYGAYIGAKIDVDVNVIKEDAIRTLEDIYYIGYNKGIVIFCQKDGKIEPYLFISPRIHESGLIVFEMHHAGHMDTVERCYYITKIGKLERRFDLNDGYFRELSIEIANRYLRGYELEYKMKHGKDNRKLWTKIFGK
jgi:hypothetical protein